MLHPHITSIIPGLFVDSIIQAGFTGRFHWFGQALRASHRRKWDKLRDRIAHFRIRYPPKREMDCIRCPSSLPPIFRPGFQGRFSRHSPGHSRLFADAHDVFPAHSIVSRSWFKLLAIDCHNFFFHFIVCPCDAFRHPDGNSCGSHSSN